MRWAVCILVAVLFAAQPVFAQCGPGGCPVPQAPQVPQAQSSIRAPVSTSTPPEWLCNVFGASGMLIYKDATYGVILSAYHVPRGEPRDGIRIRFPDGSRYTGRVLENKAGEISADKEWDVVAILIAAPKASPCRLATSNPPVGSPVWIVGYGAGRYRVRQLAVQKYEQKRDIYLHGRRGSGAIPGDSGGAMVNGRGELCGVISCSDWKLWSGSPSAGQLAIGPSLRAIHALCSNEEFNWPWLGWRKRAEGHIERLDADKADRAEIPDPPPPAASESIARIEQKIDALPKPSAQSGEMEGIMDALEANAVEDAKDRARIESLEKSLATARELVAGIDPADLDGAVAQAQAAVEAAMAAQAEAQQAKQVAGAVPAEAAKAAMNAVDEKLADPSFLAKLGGWLKPIVGDGLIPGNQLEMLGKIPTLVATVSWMRWACYGLGAYCIFDILMFLLYGRRTIAGRVVGAGQWAAGRTRNQADDVAMDTLAGLVESVRDMQREMASRFSWMQAADATAESTPAKRTTKRKAR